MEIRELVEADWPEVWGIVREVVAAGDAIAYDPAMTSEEARAMWAPGPGGRTVVAAEGGRALGAATMGRNRPGAGAHVATATFVVAEAARGRGVGRALGEEVIAWAGRAGYAAIQLNAVVETNLPAVRLWSSLGFRVVGTVPEAFDHPVHGRVGLHVMHRFV